MTDDNRVFEISLFERHVVVVVAKHRNVSISLKLIKK